MLVWSSFWFTETKLNLAFDNVELRMWVCFFYDQKGFVYITEAEKVPYCGNRLRGSFCVQTLNFHELDHVLNFDFKLLYISRVSKIWSFLTKCLFI